uniref:SET domain-containing protein n=1 Tax=Hymenolepis diminuta TaxID=6216 RepID=A0A0R3SVN1_HYMDI
LKIRELFKEMKNVYEFFKGFSKCQTDFQRVSFLLELCGKANLVKDGTIFGLPSKLEKVTEGMGKDDKLSEAFMQKSQHYWDMRDRRTALRYLTYSVFYARSDEQKFNAIVSRFFLLYNMENYEDALKDSNNALEIQAKIPFLVYFYTAQCYMKLNRYPEALTYFKRADEVEFDQDVDKEKYRPYLDYGLEECKKSPQLPELESKWSSYHPQPPTQLAPPITPLIRIYDKCNLKSVKDGVLKLRNTRERGWTLKTARDVSIGEVLLTEKPYVSVLNYPRTENCYHCYKRCHSLLPCSGCPYVGFCSEKCAAGAMSNDKSVGTGTGRHNYECGILPNILLNKFSSKISENQSYTGCATTSHLAYRCIANTDPGRLKSYLTSHDTGALNVTKGHQAFRGEKEIRKDPPDNFDPSDYSSIAWLESCSEKRDAIELWQKTIAALFLTYCLWISGYPIDWKKVDKEEPKFEGKGLRPLSVSHVAACMLYHLQASTVNYQDYFMILTPSRGMPPKICKSIATAIYPTISLINHSCNPSAVLVNTARGGAFLYALKPILADEEVTVCYKYSYFSSPESTRRFILKCYYHFDCNCVACTNKWFTRIQFDLGLLKCQKCKNTFSINKGKCKKCHSKVTVKRFKKLLLQLIKSKFSPTRELKSREKCTLIWRDMQALIRPCGACYAYLQSLYNYLILEKFGNLSIEPFN